MINKGKQQQSNFLTNPGQYQKTQGFSADCDDQGQRCNFHSQQEANLYGNVDRPNLFNGKRSGIAQYLNNVW